MTYDYSKNPLPNIQEPFLIYKAGKNPVRVYAVDLPGWKANGWSMDENSAIATVNVASEPVAEQSLYESRKAELEGLLKQSWRKIAAIAEPLEIAKPEGGWDEAIALILEAEGLKDG
jgi:hypothetical protein